MDVIPTEICLAIFECLQANDAARLASVCNRFRSVWEYRTTQILSEFAVPGHELGADTVDLENHGKSLLNKARIRTLEFAEWQGRTDVGTLSNISFIANKRPMVSVIGQLAPFFDSACFSTRQRISSAFNDVLVALIVSPRTTWSTVTLYNYDDTITLSPKHWHGYTQGELVRAFLRTWYVPPCDQYLWIPLHLFGYFCHIEVDCEDECLAVYGICSPKFLEWLRNRRTLAKKCIQ